MGQLSPRGIKVSWLPLECEDVNAQTIVEYIIRYHKSGSGSEQMRVAPSSPFTILDSELETLTAYEVSVAAVNSVGAGGFSTPVQAFIFVG